MLDPCERCFGEGRRRETTTVTIDIPAGVSDGMELRVAGNGHAGIAGGPAGDLYVGISVEPAEEFDRRGQDLFTVLDVSMTQATLGAELEIEALDGPEHISVEPGTESGTVVRIKGGGVPNVNRRGRGDLYVTLHVVTPADLSREERKLWERLAELRGERTSKREPARRAAAAPGVLTQAESEVGSAPWTVPASSAGSRPARSRPTSCASPTGSSRSAT